MWRFGQCAMMAEKVSSDNSTQESKINFSSFGPALRRMGMTQSSVIVPWGSDRSRDLRCLRVENGAIISFERPLIRFNATVSRFGHCVTRASVHPSSQRAVSLISNVNRRWPMVSSVDFQAVVVIRNGPVRIKCWRECKRETICARVGSMSRPQ